MLEKNNTFRSEKKHTKCLRSIHQVRQMTNKFLVGRFANDGPQIPKGFMQGAD